MPQRIQRKRTKGWKLPPNTVIVTRPGSFGNCFTVTDRYEPGTRIGGEYGRYIAVPTEEDAVECYRLMLAEPEMAEFVERIKRELRGKDVACYCRVGALWCHGDVLIEVANA